MTRKICLDGQPKSGLRFACRELGFGQPVAEAPHIASVTCRIGDLFSMLGDAFHEFAQETRRDGDEGDESLERLLAWGGDSLIILIRDDPALASEILREFFAFEVLEFGFGPYSSEYDYYLNRLSSLCIEDGSVMISAEAYGARSV